MQSSGYWDEAVGTANHIRISARLSQVHPLSGPRMEATKVARVQRQAFSFWIFFRPNALLRTAFWYWSCQG